MESYHTHLRQARKYGWWRKSLATGRPFVARPVQRKRGRLCISRLYMGEHDRLKRLFSLGCVPHTDRCVAQGKRYYLLLAQQRALRRCSGASRGAWSDSARSVWDSTCRHLTKLNFAMECVPTASARTRRAEAAWCLGPGHTARNSPAAIGSVILANQYPRLSATRSMRWAGTFGRQRTQRGMLNHRQHRLGQLY